MKKGFSLIELLIAMTMSGMIFITVSSLLVTLLNSNTKNRRQEVFEQTKNDLFVELSNSIRWGDEISSTMDSLVVDGITYRLESGAVTRNGEAITPTAVEVTQFQIVPRSAATGFESFEINVVLKDKNFNLNTDKLDMVVSQRKTSGGNL
jgi:prepilin-type N-terminal cleavage/methylation domain-containing protein